MSLPIVEAVHPAALGAADARAPATRLACLRCQLLGRRALLCREADACKGLPHSFALGPLLVVGWLGMLVAFVIAITR